MSKLAIELSDPGIVISSDRGVIVGPSPGYAHLEGASLILGRQAQARSRLNPRRTANDFWDNLGTDPLPRPFPEQLTQADLVHRHLEALARQAEDALGDADRIDGVVLAVPGSFLTWQLGLILGIARSAGLPVSGMIDSAVASASDHARGARILHLDILLHRFVWTEIDGSSGLIRTRVEESGAAGLVSLQDAWAKLISDQFVRSTRFDPLHNAASEQDLYDRLPDWLEILKDNEVAELGLEYGGQRYSIDITKNQVIAAVQDQLRIVSSLAGALSAADEMPRILLSATAASLPGLGSMLGEIRSVDVITLSRGAAAAAALTHCAQIETEDEELPFVVRLSEAGTDIESTARVEASTADRNRVPRSRRPTHLIHGGFAYPIGEEPFWLGIALTGDQRGINLTGSIAGISRSHCHVRLVGDRVLVEDHSTYGTYLNERPINGSGEAEAGDRLRLGSPGIEIPLVAVLESDG